VCNAPLLVVSCVRERQVTVSELRKEHLEFLLHPP
jgi:hypothetical protein